MQLLRGRDGLTGRDGPPEFKVQLVHLDHLDLKGILDRKDPLDQLDPLDLKDQLVLLVAEPSTHGGERALVQKLVALSYSTPASQQEHITTNKEVEPTTCACPRTQSTAPPSRIELEHKDIHIFMAQSTKLLYKAQLITMYLVLCATYLLDQL